MIGIIKVTGLHDSYVREICTLAVVSCLSTLSLYHLETLLVE